MHATDRLRRLVRWGCLGGLTLLGAGCAVSTAPPGWLRPPTEPSNGLGGWMALALRPEVGDQVGAVTDWDFAARWNLEGELIAVSPESILVLAGSSLRGVAWSQVRRAELFGYDSQAKNLALWSTIGTLSTVSHGVGLIISAPLWILAGAASTARQGRGARILCPPGTDRDLAPFARFPQGLPPGIDRARVGGGPPATSPRPSKEWNSLPGA